jgi:hypothetical protein
MLPTGTIHKDMTGGTNGFRNIIVYISNDSTIPVNLQIAFPNEYINLKQLAEDSLKKFFHTDSMRAKVPNKYKVFLIPDSLKDKVLYQEYSSPSKELELFLNSKLDACTTLMKVIEPKETYKLSLGFLISPDGLTRAALFSKGHQHNLSIPDKEIKFSDANKNGLDLILGVTLYSDYSVIPCGQLFYSN